MIKSGDKYRHYKGGIYKIVCIAKHADSRRTMVIYESVDDLKLWALDFNAFDSIKIIDGRVVKRFEVINEKSK